MKFRFGGKKLGALLCVGELEGKDTVLALEGSWPSTCHL